MEEIVAGFTRDQITVFILAGIGLLVLVYWLWTALSARSQRAEREQLPEVSSAEEREVAHPRTGRPRPRPEGDGESSLGAWVLTTPGASRNRIWYLVPEGENWVTTLFKKAFRVLEPGLNATIPYFEEVGARVPVRIFRVDLKATDLNARSGSDVPEADVIIRIDAVCFARIIDPKIVAYDLELARSLEDQRLVKIDAVRDFIRETIIARLRQFTATRTIDDLMVARAQDVAELVQDIQDVLRSFGIRVSNFQISQPILHEELLKARAQLAITEQVTAAELLEAKREKEMARVRAQGQSAAFLEQAKAVQEAIQKGLTPETLRSLMALVGLQFAAADERQSPAQTVFLMGAGDSGTGEATLGVLLARLEQLEKEILRAGTRETGLTSEQQAQLQSDLADIKNHLSSPEENA